MNAIYVLCPAGTIAVLFFSFFMFKRQNAIEIVYSGLSLIRTLRGNLNLFAL